MKTTDFDAQRKTLHEEYLLLMRTYAGELVNALRQLKEKRASEKLEFSDVEGGLRMIGLGLQRVGLPAELRDGEEPTKPKAPPKAGSRLKRLRLIG